MIFNCGKTHEAQQKILEDWHVIFAWLPHTVTIDSEGNTTCAWLQRIERKCTRDLFNIESTEYRLLK